MERDFSCKDRVRSTKEWLEKACRGKIKKTGFQGLKPPTQQFGGGGAPSCAFVPVHLLQFNWDKKLKSDVSSLAHCLSGPQISLGPKQTLFSHSAQLPFSQYELQGCVFRPVLRFTSQEDGSRFWISTLWMVEQSV